MYILMYLASSKFTPKVTYVASVIPYQLCTDLGLHLDAVHHDLDQKNNIFPNIKIYI